MPRETVEEARQHLTRLTDDARTILASVSRVFDEHEALRADLAVAQAEGAGLREQVLALQAERIELRGQIREHESRGGQLRDQLAALEADSAAARAQLRALQGRHAELAQQVAASLRDVLERVLPEVADAPGGGPGPAVTAVPDWPQESAGPGVAAQAVAAPAPGADPEPALPAAAVATAPERELEAPWREVPRNGGADDDAGPSAPRGLASADARDDGERTADGTPREDRTRILLIDDESYFTDLMAEFLVGRGFEVRTAPTGEQGLEVAAEFRPRIVLLDLMMPGVGGMETLRRIKSEQPETSVIMVTAIDDRDTARKALALGASDYVTKPLTLDFLESVLAVHLPGVLPVPLPAVDEPVRAAAPAADATASFFARH